MLTSGQTGAAVLSGGLLLTAISKEMLVIDADVSIALNYKHAINTYW